MKSIHGQRCTACVCLVQLSQHWSQSFCDVFDNASPCCIRYCQQQTDRPSLTAVHCHEAEISWRHWWRQLNKLRTNNLELKSVAVADLRWRHVVCTRSNTKQISHVWFIVDADWTVTAAAADCAPATCHTHTHTHIHTTSCQLPTYVSSCHTGHTMPAVRWRPVKRDNSEMRPYCYTA